MGCVMYETEVRVAQLKYKVDYNYYQLMYISS